MIEGGEASMAGFWRMCADVDTASIVVVLIISALLNAVLHNLGTQNPKPTDGHFLQLKEDVPSVLPNVTTVSARAIGPRNRGICHD